MTQSIFSKDEHARCPYCGWKTSVVILPNGQCRCNKCQKDFPDNRREPPYYLDMDANDPGEGT